MTVTARPRRWRLLLLAAAALATMACQPVSAVGAPGPSAQPSPTGTGGLPASMAALGDSITTGFGSCLALVSCPRNSWSTGDGTVVTSQYERILAGNPAIRGNAHNLAQNGARAADLPGQATAAVKLRPQYVTILIGANDACRATVDDMTSVAEFHAEVASALATLHSGLPDAHILVLSIPDVYQVWATGHTNRTAVQIWSLGVCPALLANAASTASADDARRQTFRKRIEAYDGALEQVCRQTGPRCRFDGGAVHRVQFATTDLSALDFFHPNTEGQNKLAQVSYPGRITW